jgi:hypothetical protein
VFNGGVKEKKKKSKYSSAGWDLNGYLTFAMWKISITKQYMTYYMITVTTQTSN